MASSKKSSGPKDPRRSGNPAKRAAAVKSEPAAANPEPPVEAPVVRPVPVKLKNDRAPIYFWPLLLLLMGALSVASFSLLGGFKEENPAVGLYMTSAMLASGAMIALLALIQFIMSANKKASFQKIVVVIIAILLVGTFAGEAILGGSTTEEPEPETEYEVGYATIPESDGNADDGAEK